MSVTVESGKTAEKVKITTIKNYGDAVTTTVTEKDKDKYLEELNTEKEKNTETISAIEKRNAEIDNIINEVNSL